MRVLVTGATGTIGRELVGELLRKEEEVYALERYVAGRYRLDVNEKARIVYGDLRDFSAMRHAVEEVQPDVVIHLAAAAAVAYSYDHPNEVIETNFTGTVNLAEACHTLVPHLKQFLFASTSETYGNGPVPRTEETAQNPNSPYAVSKHAAEKYLLYLSEAFKFPVTMLRPFNTYGRKNNQHFVVERIVVQMLRGGEVTLGDPSAIRDFLYLDDHVRAYLSCLDNPRAIGQTFNFCTGKGTSIERLCEKVARLTDFKGQVIWHRTPMRPLDIKELVGSYSKVERVLGWRPTVDLDEGLSRTVDYWGKKASLNAQAIR